MNKTIRRQVAKPLAMLCVILTVLLTWLGGIGTGSSSAATAPSSSTLHIGVFANVTGPPQDNPEHDAPAILRAWARDVNHRGGLAGHPVQFVIKDTKADAPTATAAAQAFAHDPSIIGVIMFDAGAEFALSGPVSSSGIPVLGGMRYVPIKQPNWYSEVTGFPAGIDAGWVIGKKLGAKRVAEVVCVEIPDCAAEDPISRKAAQTLGMTFEGTIKAAFSEPDYTAECLTLKQDRVNYVFIQIETSAALRLISQCRTQGVTASWGMTQGLIVPQVLQQQDKGIPIHFALFSFPWFASAAPAQAYRAMMKRQGVPQSVWATPDSTAAYVTAQLFAQVIRANAASLPQVPTRADIARIYGTVKNQTLGGLLPQALTFTAGQPQPPVNCYWLGLYSNGRFSSQSLSQPTCDSPSLGA